MSETLKEFWKFEDADLAANRNGQLSEKQKIFLTGEHKTQKNVFLGVGGVIAVLFCCLPVLLIGSKMVLPLLISGDLGNLQELLPFAALGGIGLVGIGMAVLVIGAVVGVYLLRAGKKADITVKHAEGKAAYSWGTKRVRTPGSNVRSYEDVRVLHLSFGDKEFEVHEQLQDVIKEGEEWTIYYTSTPFKFLSGEKVNP